MYRPPPRSTPFPYTTLFRSWMFSRFEQAQARRENQPKLVESPKRVPEPRLQVSPPDDLQELLRQENQILSTYGWIDRKSTRLNSSHEWISYAVFCLKKKIGD